MPTLSFTVAGDAGRQGGRAPRRQPHRDRQRHCSGGNRLLDALGVNDEGGAVTVGLAPYTTRYEINQLVADLGTLG